MMKTLILILLALSGAILCLFTAFTVAFRRGRKTAGEGARQYPFVSLLKPVKNIDDDMDRNLESFFTLDYPLYEVLFAVDHISDPCVAVIESVRRKYPEVNSAILETGNNGFQNPKIHKLALLEARSRGELLWATDSNIRVERDTLGRLVNEYLRSGAKAIFSPVRGTSSRTFASLIENTSLNFFTSGSIITAWQLLRQHIVVGKSILIEKKALGTFGGFGYFKNYLAEDFLLGEAFVRSGFRVSTNYTWVTNVNERSTIGSFFRRMVRWAKLRYHLRPAMYAAEVLLNPIVMALFAFPFMGRRGPALLGGVILLKVALEYINFLVVNREDRRRPAWHLLFPAVVIVKDLLYLGFYLVPFLSRRVVWQGNNISIGKKTLIFGSSPTDNLSYEGA
jgi:ceramide glucosyltransferase